MKGNRKSMFWYAYNGVEWDLIPTPSKIRFTFYTGIVLGSLLGFSAGVGLVLILSS